MRPMISRCLDRVLALAAQAEPESCRHRETPVTGRRYQHALAYLAN